jgi:hypothetical protein
LNVKRICQADFTTVDLARQQYANNPKRGPTPCWRYDSYISISRGFR